MDEGRDKALKATLEELGKRYGDGAVVRLGDARHLQVEVIPTGSLALDIALGVGGIPRGRVTEIYGPESAGKTTLCLHVIREAQLRGGVCAFVDMEHALDPTFAARIGVDVNNLYISQPDTAEQALEITESLVRSGAIDVTVVDSVAALVPRAEIEGEMGDAHVGLQARLMSQALRKLSGAIKQSQTAVLFTNQLREKIGVMFGCFHYDARVVLADGTTEKIGKIVNQRIEAEVLSYNNETRQFEPRRIVRWFDNGPTSTFLQFKVAANGGSGFHKFACTPNHLLLTENGYRPAGELKVGDRLITAVPFYLKEKQEMLAQWFHARDIHPRLNERGRFEPLEARPEKVLRPIGMPIVDIYEKPQSKKTHRFDLEIEGNHSYLVDGVVVHNSPETTSGGRALKFYASVRLDIRRVQAIKQGGEVVGNRTHVRVTKNKVAPPFKEAEFDIMFSEGISREGDILDIASELGIVEKRGAFFRYNEGMIGQGRENAKQYLKENPPLMAEVEDAVRQHFGLPPLFIPADGSVPVAPPDEGESKRRGRKK